MKASTPIGMLDDPFDLFDKFAPLHAITFIVSSIGIPSTATPPMLQFPLLFSTRMEHHRPTWRI
jgi:hypothetical protein